MKLGAFHGGFPGVTSAGLSERMALSELGQVDLDPGHQQGQLLLEAVHPADVGARTLSATPN